MIGNNDDETQKPKEIEAREGHEKGKGISYQDEEDDDGDAAPITLLTQSHLMNAQTMEYIYQDLHRHYYALKDWSIFSYILQAYHGFIAVSFGEEYLLPEIQRTYCLLEFNDLHIPHGVMKRIKKHYQPPNHHRDRHQLQPPQQLQESGNHPLLTLRINSNLTKVLEGIQRHHHPNNWVNQNYSKLLHQLFQEKLLQIGEATFQFMTVELWMRRGKPHGTANEEMEEGGKENEEEEILIAGEIGYQIGSVYTSLTGFSLHEYPSSGLIQLIALGLALKRCGYSFWSLGHPPRPGGMMKYKADLGAIVITREQFLRRWMEDRAKRPQNELLSELEVPDVAGLVTIEFQRAKLQVVAKT